MKRLHDARVRVVLTAFSLFVSAPASAGVYDFVNVADSGPGTPYATDGAFNTLPAINSDGTVVFTAGLKTGGSAVVTRTRGGDYATVATANSFGVTLGINDFGTVAFVAKPDPNDPSIAELQLATPRRGITTIAGNTQGYIPYNLHLTNTGSIVFNSGGGIYLADPNGTISLLVNLGQNNFVGLGAIPSVNEGGTVAFRGITAIGDGIWVRTPDGKLTALVGADASTPGFGPYQTFQDPVINSSGQIAISAILRRHNGQDQNQLLLYTPGEGLSLLVDNGAINHLGINDEGTVAFAGGLPEGGGIFTGADPVNDKVVAYGDPLFGSTVTGLDQYGAINRRGDVAFQYSLADGREGVGVAYAVPEPSPGLALSIAGFALLWRRRKLPSQ